MSLSKRALGVLSAAALALSLAACSGAAPTSSASADREAMSAPTAQPTAQPEETADARPMAEPTPDGYTTTTVSEHGFSFATPAEWKAIEVNPGTPEYETGMQLTADKLGVSVDQVKAQIQGFAAFLMASEPDETGFSENLNVSKQLFDLPTAPTESEVRQLIERFGTVDSVETKQTSLGPVVFAYYSSVLGDATFTGAAGIVPTGEEGKWAQITITSSKLDRAKELADVVARTLAK